MNFSDNTVLSVKALNDFVKRIVEGNSYLSSVNIRGEISNFTNHYKSGHYYFSIKDEEAQVRCVMFSSYSSKLEFVPKEDSQVEKLLKTRKDIFDKYDENNFEKEFKKYFNIIKKDKIEDSYRTIYLMESKNEE